MSTQASIGHHTLLKQHRHCVEESEERIENGIININLHYLYSVGLCGLVVRVLGYRSGGQGSIPGTTRKKIVGLERGPPSLVSTTEEILDRKVSAPV
jgi:hypothetical protein